MHFSFNLKTHRDQTVIILCEGDHPKEHWLQAVLTFSHDAASSFKRLKGTHLYQLNPAGLICLDIKSRVNFYESTEFCVLPS